MLYFKLPCRLWSNVIAKYKFGVSDAELHDAPKVRTRGAALLGQP